jgi:hypothetical protein
VTRAKRGFIMFWRAMITAVAAGALALTGTAAAQAAPASGGQLTGTQLESFLLPASYFGAGYWFPEPKYNPEGSGSSLEHPVDKVNLSSYSCRQNLENELPFSGYGETAYADAQAIKGKLSSWSSSYYEQVYQFPSAAAALSYYRENLQFSMRCGNSSATSGGKTTTQTLQSLTTGHVDGGLAFYELLKTRNTGYPDAISGDEWVVVGQYVYNLDAFSDVGQPRLTPNAATLKLIARVKSA